MIVKHVYTARTRPCTRAANTAVFTCTQPCTRPVHGHGLCTRANDRVTCYTAVYGRAHDRVHSTYTCTEPYTRQCVQHMAVYTGRVCCHQWTRSVYTAVWCTHCRVHMPNSRPYTRRVHGRVHGHVRAVYTVAVYTAVYTARTRPRPMYTAVYTVVYTTLFTAHLHGRAHGP